MNCPVDATPLAMADREGIEIDYCPKCRGVWLDRGELDKIIERVADDYGGGGAPYEQGGRRYESEHGRYKDEGGGHGRRGQGRKRRKESMLGELFDFG